MIRMSPMGGSQNPAGAGESLMHLDETGDDIFGDDEDFLLDSDNEQDGVFPLIQPGQCDQQVILYSAMGHAKCSGVKYIVWKFYIQ